MSSIDETTAEIKAKRDELASKFDEKYGDYIDFIAKKLHAEIGDDLYYAENYVKDAINSAKEQLEEQLKEQLEKIPFPEFP